MWCVCGVFVCVCACVCVCMCVHVHVCICVCTCMHVYGYYVMDIRLALRHWIWDVQVLRAYLCMRSEKVAFLCDDSLLVCTVQEVVQ